MGCAGSSHIQFLCLFAGTHIPNANPLCTFESSIGYGSDCGDTAQPTDVCWVMDVRSSNEVDPTTCQGSRARSKVRP
jgi:hypothetical protein